MSGTGELRKSGTSTFTLGTAGITGAGALTKTGAGTLVLTGNNTYQGGTTLAAGTLKVGSTGAINSTGTLTFTGGPLQYGSANQTDYSGRFSTDNNQAYYIDTNGQTVTFSTDLHGNNNPFTKSGAGTLILASKNSYDGGTTINGGILRLGRDENTLSDTGAITVNGGTLDLATRSDTVGTVHLNSGNITGSGTLTSDSAFNVKSGTISANLAGSASLTKTTSGVVTLAGTNTFTGQTTINAGRIKLTGSAADSAFTVNSGGTLSDSGTLGDLTLGSTLLRRRKNAARYNTNITQYLECHCEEPNQRLQA